MFSSLSFHCGRILSKAGALFLLLSASLLMSACGGGGGSTATSGNPGVSSFALNLTNVNQTGGTVSSSPTGINCGSGACTATFSAGTAVTLTESARVGYVFAGWSGACSGTTPTCVVPMSAVSNVTANFILQSSSYMLNVSTAGQGQGTVISSVGGISCPTTCSASIPAGTNVTLTATAGTNYSFTGWSGACSGSATTCVVPMSTVQSVTATFTSPYLLTVTNTGSGSGNVTTSAGSFTCVSGSCSSTVCNSGICTDVLTNGASVTLTAAAASGSTFSGWSGACTGTGTCVTTMSGTKNVTATFASTSSCVQSGSSTSLAHIVTNASGTTTTNTSLTSSCPSNVGNGGAVDGICYGNYAVQSNSYNSAPANIDFSMWSNSATCWGIKITQPTNASAMFWNAPLATRGFSFGYNGWLGSSGGLSVAALNTQYASTSTHCPASGTSGSVCAKWSMSVPGVVAQSAVNTASNTYSNWDALMDIYFHSTAQPSASQDVVFDLQIYQMLMDYTAGGSPNWATWLLGTYTTKTIGGITYLVSVNMQDPGTEGSNYVGYGGTRNTVAMFPLPTYPTSGGAGSYLWGLASATHDVGGIIAWLSQTTTNGSQTGIFDDAGHLLFDNARNANVTSPLISPSFYLTGLNPGYEVVTATPSVTYPNNNVFTTTNFWVAIPGEAIGN